MNDVNGSGGSRFPIRLALYPCYLRGSIVKLEVIAVREGVGELLLMRHEQDAAHLPAQVLKFLDHDLPTLAIEAAKALVNDHRFDRPMLPTGVLSDAQGQADCNAELLTSAEESHIDG